MGPAFGRRCIPAPNPTALTNARRRPPGWRCCSSLKYPRDSRSSRLPRRAPRRPRCRARRSEMGSGDGDGERSSCTLSDLRPPPPDSPHHADEDEDIEARPVTAVEARRMVARGEIVDLKTAFGLTLV